MLGAQPSAAGRGSSWGRSGVRDERERERSRGEAGAVGASSAQRTALQRYGPDHLGFSAQRAALRHYGPDHPGLLSQIKNRPGFRRTSLVEIAQGTPAPFLQATSVPAALGTVFCSHCSINILVYCLFASNKCSHCPRGLDHAFCLPARCLRSVPPSAQTRETLVTHAVYGHLLLTRDADSGGRLQRRRRSTRRSAGASSAAEVRRTQRDGMHRWIRQGCIVSLVRRRAGGERHCFRTRKPAFSPSTARRRHQREDMPGSPDRVASSLWCRGCPPQSM